MSRDIGFGGFVWFMIAFVAIWRFGLDWQGWMVAALAIAMIVVRWRSARPQVHGHIDSRGSVLTAPSVARKVDVKKRRAALKR